MRESSLSTGGASRRCACLRLPLLPSLIALPPCPPSIPRRQDWGGPGPIVCRRAQKRERPRGPPCTRALLFSLAQFFSHLRPLNQAEHDGVLLPDQGAPHVGQGQSARLIHRGQGGRPGRRGDGGRHSPRRGGRGLHPRRPGSVGRAQLRRRRRRPAAGRSVHHHQWPAQAGRRWRHAQVGEGRECV